MIIKGGSRGSAGNLAAHLLRTDQNERVRIIELSGVAADTLAGALSEMAAQAAGTTATRPLYHVSISPDPKAPPLTKGQWDRAISRLEERLGLTGCARAVIEHEKDGRIHRHVVWSRTSPLTGRILSDSLNWRIHSEVAAELAAEFGHARTRRTYDRPAGVARPSRNPKDWEEQQKARTGVDPRLVRREVTAIYRSADSGRSFQAGLAAAGYILARGDKPGVLVLIDRAGGVHGLTRRIEGATAAEIKARLSDLDLATLPTVKGARAMLREKDGGQVPPKPGLASRVGGRRVTLHSGHLPKPSGLKGPPHRIPRADPAALISGGCSKQPKPPELKPQASVIDVAIPEERPGIDPLQILDAIQKLKRALGNGAEVGAQLQKLETLYGRLMLNG